MFTSGQQAREVLLELEEQRCRAIGSQDWARLDSILDDELVWIHMSGRVEDKMTFMRRASGRTELVARGHLEVRVLGETALMTGEVQVTPIVDGLPGGILRAVALQVWVHRSVGWRMLAIAHARLVP